MRKYSIAIGFLNDFVEENLNEKIASKNIKRALRNRNANKTAELFRSNFVFIVGTQLLALHNV